MVAISPNMPALTSAAGLGSVVLSFVTLTGCAAQLQEEQPTQPPATRVQVSLYHCGFDPLVHNGKTWEIPEPPFDATNAPEDWAGTGTITSMTERTLVFIDDSGIKVTFVPDDGSPLPLCA